MSGLGFINVKATDMGNKFFTMTNQSKFGLNSGGSHVPQTVSILKANSKSQELDALQHVNQNGKEIAVQRAEPYCQQQESIALAKLINLSEKSLLQQGEITVEEVFEL